MEMLKIIIISNIFNGSGMTHYSTINRRQEMSEKLAEARASNSCSPNTQCRGIYT